MTTTTTTKKSDFASSFPSRKTNGFLFIYIFSPLKDEKKSRFFRITYFNVPDGRIIIVHSRFDLTRPTSYVIRSRYSEITLLCYIIYYDIVKRIRFNVADARRCAPAFRFEVRTSCGFRAFQTFRKRATQDIAVKNIKFAFKFEKNK